MLIKSFLYGSHPALSGRLPFVKQGSMGYDEPVPSTRPRRHVRWK